MSIPCIVATNRAGELNDLIAGLKSGGMTVTVAADGKTVLSGAMESNPGLIVIDEGLPDFAPLDLVMEIIKVNALANTAVLSSMSAKAFHDKSEGYGVLCALPVNPGEEDGTALATQAKRIMGMS